MAEYMVVKDWFHEKKMNELRKNVQSTNVLAVLQESEKALKVLVADTSSSMTYWVPKTCVIEVEEWSDEDGQRGQAVHHHKYITTSNYEEAIEYATLMMSMYK